MSKLAGKVAVVTGASKGIGAAIARALGGAGAAVIVNYAGDRQGAERTVAAIAKTGGKAIAVQADVSKPEQVTRLFEETKQAFGRLDVLVNNAGIYKFFPIEELTEAEFQRQFGTNVFGLLQVTKEAVGQFGPEGGSIVNISSVVSKLGVPGAAVYAGTKGAVDSITAALAKELAPRKIRVNAINPGGVETEGLHAMGVPGSDMEKQMIAQTPLGRLGQPDDIGPIALFLASSDSGWVTGETLWASGGMR
jgi:3-oxoacyl-[acyl-carrier protein] reductase